MATFRGDRSAPGAPGNPPRWSHGDKDGIGTAYSAASRLWYTIWNGIVTEIYYPNVDSPQTRDLQYLFSDNATFFHEETRYLKTDIEQLGRGLGYCVRGEDPEGRYHYTKEIIANPHLSCLLQRTRVKAAPEWQSKLRLYALLAPHLEVAGWGNNGYVVQVLSSQVLVAEREGIWLAMGTWPRFTRASVGYVGQSDGWTDLAHDFKMDWEYDVALKGNIALTGEIDLSATPEFTLGIAFGNSMHRAISTLMQSLVEPFDDQLRRFDEQWIRTESVRQSLDRFSGDGGQLFRTSYQLLLAHEDKTFPGAIVASLAIPWGQARGDEEGEGGYHLVWTRDLVQCAMGLIAAGNTATPLRALIYLAASQNADGSVAQNFWLDGTEFWPGRQLDEVAFPILLAHRLHAMDAVATVTPHTFVYRAAGYLLRQGPATPQERWEEASGYSPSTMAAVIAALLCTADFARHDNNPAAAEFAEQYADWLEHNLENWMATNDGTLVPGIRKHFIRITPANPGDPLPDDGPADRTLTLTSRPPGEQASFPAKEIVDAGFLELVRYGIRRPDDPVILDSIRVIDAVIKADLPNGTFWRRYNHDGYGQQADGQPYTSYGRGRVWPLFSGERGHYEIAAGRDGAEQMKAMEASASPTHLIPEQSWDDADIPELHLFTGRPTGSAMPLLWAHAEYIKLLRSRQDGHVFDRIPCVAERYLEHHPPAPQIQFWTFATPSLTVKANHTLRVMAQSRFCLRYSTDEWQNTQEQESNNMEAFNIQYADVSVPAAGQSVRFTFFWPGDNRWEGRDFAVRIVASAD